MMQLRYNPFLWGFLAKSLIHALVFFCLDYCSFLILAFDTSSLLRNLPKPPTSLASLATSSQHIPQQPPSLVLQSRLWSSFPLSLFPHSPSYPCPCLVRLYLHPRLSEHLLLSEKNSPFLRGWLPVSGTASPNRYQVPPLSPPNPFSKMPLALRHCSNWGSNQILILYLSIYLFIQF